MLGRAADNFFRCCFRIGFSPINLVGFLTFQFPVTELILIPYYGNQKNVKIIGAHINIGNFNADLDTLQKIWQNNVNGNFYFEI